MTLAAPILDPASLGGVQSRYTLVTELAAGGMGTIFRALDSVARREVAFKRLLTPVGSDRALLTRLFQREFGALKRLPHPNIVEVYDYGLDASGPYYTMELLSGGDLTTVAPMQHAKACRVLRDVASALALMHARRWLHRDVTPRNVRLLDDGRVKLMDFGGLTTFGKPREIVGTAAFMAPECVRDAELNQAADLYSLGAVAYYLLTGQMRSVLSLDELASASFEPPAPPSELASDIPPELDGLVLSLLSEDPRERPASAAYVIDKLTSIAALPAESDERRVAYSYLAQPPLVGRATLLETLDGVARAAALGKGRSLLIEGATGLGRSALVDRVEVLAQLQGLTVLRAECVGASAPFSLVRRLVELALAVNPGLGARAGRLDSLFPHAGAPQPVRTAADVAMRRALALKLSESVLRMLSEQHPLLVLVDDVHLADAESLALIAALAETVGTCGLSFVTTAASASRSSDVHAYEKLRTSGALHTLAPLTAPDFVTLLHETFGNVPHSGRLAMWLHGQSGGSPGHCFALVRYLLERGEVHYTVGTFTLPHDVAQTADLELSTPLTALLETASHKARLVAAVLALHDGALRTELLASVCEVGDYEVLRAADELAHRALVRKVADGLVLESELFRASLVGTLDEARAVALHAKIGRALVAAGTDSVEHRLGAALHFLNADQHDEAERLLAPVTGDLLLLSSGAHRAIPVLEAMLHRYRATGRSERECLRWLIPIVTLAFFGHLDAHRRYVEQTLPELARLCGMVLAMRLRPWLGAPLALAIGLVYAGFRRQLTPVEQRLGSLREMLTSLFSIVMSAAATGASAFDAASAERAVAWIEPLAALPERSVAAMARQWCIATAELGTGSFEQSARRFAGMLRVLSKRKTVRGFAAGPQRALYLGALNGLAQAEVANCAPVALELADQLEREGSVLFAPHPECTRMAYYAQRGEIERAETHRLRAEQLALRGGSSWAFVTVLAVRWAYAACQTRDVIRLVQAVAELERLLVLAPNMRFIKHQCEAWLEFLRGRVDGSLRMFEQVAEDDVAQKLASRRLAQLMFATVLNAAGQHQRAKNVCAALEAQGSMVINLRDAQLGLAEAGLGNIGLAVSLLDAVIVRASPDANPLELGNAHRDRANVALLASDGEGFERHLHAASACFRSTGNPSLIHQVDALLAEGVRRELLLPQSRALLNESTSRDLSGATSVEGITVPALRRQQRR